VKTDSADSGFVHVSIRVSAKLRSRLNGEARHRHITLNSLINAILEKYDSFDKILLDAKAIPLSEAFFVEILELTSIEEIESIAKKLGAKVMRQSFASQGIEFNLDNLIEFYFEPLSEYSGWYQFNWAPRRHESQADLHALARPEVDRILRRYYAVIIRSATGVDPDVTVEEGVITFTCR
jgi:hypothetical protein